LGNLNPYLRVVQVRADTEALSVDAATKVKLLIVGLGLLNLAIWGAKEILS
jgi:hypothetical protein